LVFWLFDYDLTSGGGCDWRLIDLFALSLSFAIIVLCRVPSPLNLITKFMER
jgi:hypothetical protein